MRIYVGNLPFKTTDDELASLFSEFGSVEAADVIRYSKTGRSKGYAFVVMGDDGGDKAIQTLNKHEIQGRILKVREAKPRSNFPTQSEEENSDEEKNQSDQN